LISPSTKTDWMAGFIFHLQEPLVRQTRFDNGLCSEVPTLFKCISVLPKHQWFLILWHCFTNHKTILTLKVQSKTVKGCIFVENINYSKLCFSPNALSFISCASHFKQPVPNSISTYSSSIGITLPQIGTIVFCLSNEQNVRHLINTNRSIAKNSFTWRVLAIESLHFLSDFIYLESTISLLFFINTSSSDKVVFASGSHLPFGIPYKSNLCCINLQKNELLMPTYQDP
jgi:hypothetical protein